jgi:hypothetical protein
MPLPVTFATLTQGNQPASLFDTQFAAEGALVHIPCTATGQNAVTLTLAANAPTITAYTDLAPCFLWVQAQTTTGAVTIKVSGLGFLNAYRNNGQTAIGSGDLVAGFAYQAFPLSTLNGGAGGWVVDAFSTAAAGGAFVSVGVFSGSQTITIPANCTKGFVELWGGTGGSGGASGSFVSGGTGAGAYLEQTLLNLTPGNTLIYTQGGAGAAGTAAPGNGGNGGQSKLESGTQTFPSSPLIAGASLGSLAASAANTAATLGGQASGAAINVTGQSGTVGGAGGRNFFSIGADGATTAGAGNAGSTGGLKITWFT